MKAGVLLSALCVALLASDAHSARKKHSDLPLPLGITLTHTNPSKRAIVTKPLNDAMYAGSTAQFHCSVENAALSRVYWIEYTNNGSPNIISDGSIIAPGHPNNADYSILQPTQNDFNLQIRNVELADGGTYMCMDSMSGPPDVYQAFAELIVHDAPPVCSSLVPADGVVLEGQQYQHQCEVQYKGGFAADYTWEGAGPWNNLTIVTNATVFGAIAFVIDRNMDTKNHRVTLNFTEQTNVAENVAGNAPTLTHETMFQQLFVYWGPKNMYVVPDKEIYDVGEEIECFADAFPDPMFEWQNLDSLVRTPGPKFTLTADMAGKTILHICSAQNLIQGFPFPGTKHKNVTIPALTTTAMPTTPAVTTPVPAEADCDDLSGRWISDSPRAELRLQTEPDVSGKVIGFFKNGTDQFFTEMIGRTKQDTFGHVGVTGILPGTKGLVGLAGECHKCYGVEMIHVNSMWRSKSDSATCGDGGKPGPHDSYVFWRLTVSPSEDDDIKIYKPTKEITGRIFGERKMKSMEYVF